MNWFVFVLFVILGLAVFFPLSPWINGPRPAGNAGRFNAALAVIYLVCLVIWILHATGVFGK